MQTYKFEPLSFLGIKIYPGENKKIEIPVSRLPTQTWVSIPVQVIYGTKPGPCLGLISGIHGDEINGMEIIRESVSLLDPKKLSGCVILVPVVNVFGFLNGSRYLPDRRDLNRSFPGSEKGSMASRLAYLFSKEIISKTDYIIDFHTAAMGKMNYPHIRCSKKNKANIQLANAFGPPIIVHTNLVEGSLRQTAVQMKANAIVYEAGEVNRFNNDCIQTAVKGVKRVLNHLKMTKVSLKKETVRTKISGTSKWIRASRSGIYRLFFNPGDMVKEKQTIGVISNIFGETIAQVKAPFTGMIIGMAIDPKTHQGEALVHIAKV